jgi:hypothetical protein
MSIMVDKELPHLIQPVAQALFADRSLQCFCFTGIWVVNTTFGVFSGTGMRWYWYAWYF